jgi:hypothetical protein
MLSFDRRRTGSPLQGIRPRRPGRQESDSLQRAGTRFLGSSASVWESAQDPPSPRDQRTTVVDDRRRSIVALPGVAEAVRTVRLFVHRKEGELCNGLRPDAPKVDACEVRSNHRESGERPRHSPHCVGQLVHSLGPIRTALTGITELPLSLCTTPARKAILAVVRLTCPTRRPTSRTGEKRMMKPHTVHSGNQRATHEA